jgi:hypothetical protein
MSKKIYVVAVLTGVSWAAANAGSLCMQATSTKGMDR